MHVRIFRAQTNLQAIGSILDIPEFVTDVRLEAQFPTGLQGTPPTLDVAVFGKSGHVWGAESKFCEPYRTKDHRDPFKASYFPDGPGLWETRGLPLCEQLARDLRDHAISFDHLDVPQLLKHALGLSNHETPASLLFLWYDEGAAGQELQQEIRTFSDRIDAGLGFRSSSYQ